MTTDIILPDEKELESRGAVSKIHFSNCVVEALVQKLKNPKLRLRVFPARYNAVPFPHIYWQDDNYDYDFTGIYWVPWYRRLWYRGFTRRRDHGYIEKLKYVTIALRKREQIRRKQKIHAKINSIFRR